LRSCGQTEDGFLRPPNGNYRESQEPVKQMDESIRVELILVPTNSDLRAIPASSQ